MKRIGLVAAAISTAVIGLVVPVSTVSAAPADGAVGATVVEQTSPVGASGHLRPGYRVVRHFSGATCKPHSAEVGNAYNCHTRFPYDPCWLTAKRAYVVCLPSPYQRKVTRLHVARYVNRSELAKPNPMPWGLHLANGVNTTLIGRNFGEVSGQRIHYSYNQFKTVLVGPIDKTGDVWRIRVAKTTGRFRFKIGGWIDIDKAWFAEPTQLH